MLMYDTIKLEAQFLSFSWLMWKVQCRREILSKALEVIGYGKPDNNPMLIDGNVVLVVWIYYPCLILPKDGYKWTCY